MSLSPKTLDSPLSRYSPPKPNCGQNASIKCIAIGFALLAFAGCGPSSNSTVEKHSPVLPQAELAGVFDSSTETIFQATDAGQLMKLRPAGPTEVIPAATGLSVKRQAAGGGPSLRLPPFVENKKFILQIVIDSPTNTVIRLFYRTADHPEYSEDQVQTQAVTPGRNVVYFQLDQRSLIDPIRLDPGAVPGEYVIESLVARTIVSSPAR